MKRDVQLDLFAGAHLAARRGDSVDGELLLLVEGFQIERDLLQLERIEAALHDEGDRDGGGERGLHGAAVIGGEHIVDAHGADAF